jgi:glucan phosphoethanolaminetransferase (alkaline phosphatase superfamily)
MMTAKRSPVIARDSRPDMVIEFMLLLFSVMAAVMWNWRAVTYAFAGLSSDPMLSLIILFTFVAIAAAVIILSSGKDIHSLLEDE